MCIEIDHVINLNAQNRKIRPLQPNLFGSIRPLLFPSLRRREYALGEFERSRPLFPIRYPQLGGVSKVCFRTWMLPRPACRADRKALDRMLK